MKIRSGVFSFIIFSLIYSAASNASEYFLDMFSVRMTAGGYSGTLIDWMEQEDRCIEKARVSKDEYETTAQFEQRRDALRRSCEMFNPVRGAAIERAVRLSYNADHGLFTFAWKYPSQNFGCLRENHTTGETRPESLCGQVSGNRYVGHVWSDTRWNIDVSYASPLRKREFSSVFFDSAPEIVTSPQHISQGPIGFAIRSEVGKARMLRAKEASLRVVVTGNYSLRHRRIDLPPPQWRIVREAKFEITSIALVDRETDSVLALLGM